MTRAVPFGRSTLGFIALGAACAAIVVPRASADPVSPTAPTTLRRCAQRSRPL